MIAIIATAITVACAIGTLINAIRARRYARQAQEAAALPQPIIHVRGILTKHGEAEIRERFRQAVATQRPTIMREDDHHG